MQDVYQTFPAFLLILRYYLRLIFKGPGAEGRGMGSRAAPGKGLCMSWFHVILGKDGLEKVLLLLISGGISWV